MILLSWAFLALAAPARVHAQSQPTTLRALYDGQSPPADLSSFSIGSEVPLLDPVGVPVHDHAGPSASAAATSEEMICTTQSDGHFFIYKTSDPAEQLEVLDRKSTEFVRTPRALQYLVNACVGGGHCSHGVDCLSVTHCLCVANVECRDHIALASLYFFETRSTVNFGARTMWRRYTVRARNIEVGLKEVKDRCKTDGSYGTDSRQCETYAKYRFATMEEDEEDDLAYDRAVSGRYGNSGMVRSPANGGGEHSHSGGGMKGRLSYYYHPAYARHRLVCLEPIVPSRPRSSAPAWNPLMSDSRMDGPISGRRALLSPAR